MMKKLMTKTRSALSGLFRNAPAGRWRNLLLAVTVLILFFAIGFRLFLPVDELKRRLQSELSSRTETRIDIKQMSLGLPLSLKLQGVRIEDLQQEFPVFDIEMVELTPGWLSLVSGDPKVSIRGELYDGNLGLNLARSGRFDLDLAGLNLNLFPAVKLSETPVKLAGTVSGQLKASAPPLSDRSDTAIEVRIDSAAVTGLKPLGISDGEVALGNILVIGEMHGRKLNIDTISAAGGDFRIDGEGNILIGSEPARSRLNLQLNLQPESGFDPLLKDLISLSGNKPSPDGSYNFRLSGSLARPVIR